MLLCEKYLLYEIVYYNLRLWYDRSSNINIFASRMNGERMKSTSTPYDDVFRTLLNDCRGLIIPLINEVFGERYTGSEQIVFSPNEHYINQQDGEEYECITDTKFKIVGKETKNYHWECQSTADSSMAVRIFEYASQIALDEGEINENRLTVTFPHSAVLYLRSGAATPDEMRIEIKTPNGGISYSIPVMKLQGYDIDEIFEKNLLFLIPFYIFKHEKELEECDRNADKLEVLKQEYEGIKKRLEEKTLCGAINEYTKCTIHDMSKKVLRNLARKYENVREGVGLVMGGRILDYEAKTIKNEGLREGRNEGRNEGRKETARNLIRAGKMSLEEIAECTNLPLDELNALAAEESALERG